jgi:hypothetical protein
MKLSCIVLLTVILITSCATTYNGYNDSNAIINSNKNIEFVGRKNTSGNTYSFTAIRFGGIKEITTIKKEGDLNINISLKFTSGQCKIVLIKNNEIIRIYDGLINRDVDLSDMEDGEYRIKMVGNNVKKLNLSIICSQFNFYKPELLPPIY